MPRPISFLCCLLICMAAASAAEPEKVPDAGAIEQAKKLVRDLYKSEFAKKKSADQLDLARRLLKDAENTKDPAGRFVMLREARDLAARGGDVFLGLEIAAVTTQSFAQNPLEISAETLDAAEKAKIAPGRSVAEAALEVADDAVRVDDYAMAERVLKIAGSAAARSGVNGLSGTVSGRLKEVDSIRKAHELLEPARTALAANAADAAANGRIGRFNCFLKGHWEAGLVMLSKCDDDALKAAATLDLEKKLPADRASVGDRWFDLADKVEPAERPELRLRAYSAYLQAVGEAAGLDKTRIEKRLSELEKEPRIVRSKGSWTVIFRSADPTMWNTNVNRGRDQFAIALTKVPADIRYLKLTETAKNGFVVIEMTKARLGDRSEQSGYGWNGKCALDRKGYHLGIYDLGKNEYKQGNIGIHSSPNGYYYGWGFGHRVFYYDEQGFSWNSEPTPKTVFEISVKASALGPEESKMLLKKAASPK